MSTPSAGPLAGLRVIDLTQMLAGPFCTMLLADLGAEVVKVEPPGGDPTRTLPPFLPDDELRAYGGYFQSVNRNKRSIAVDLKRSDGRALFRRMVEGADVLVENFRVGVMDRLGLSYEGLREANPRLVYACVRGFGDPRTGASPYVDWPAFDIVAQAFGGLMGITGPDPEHPVKAGPGYGDLVPAMLCALGILAAVRHAERTGVGQLVDVAMADAILATTERIVFQYSYRGIVDVPQGNSHPFICPFDAFAAKDGWVTVAAPGEHFWAELCEAIGRPDIGRDPAWTLPNRVRRRDEVREIVGAWIAERTKAEVVAALGGRVPCAPVNTAADVFRDPHVAARAMLASVEHPGSVIPARICGVPVKMTETPGAVRTRAPLLGEHTAEVLRGLGLGADEVAALRASGAVR